MGVCACSILSDSFVTAWTAWTVASQVPLFLGFPRQEYWSGLLYSSPENLPNPGIEPMSVELHWHVGSLPAKPQGKQAKDIGQVTLTSSVCRIVLEKRKRIHSVLLQREKRN